MFGIARGKGRMNNEWKLDEANIGNLEKYYQTPPLS
jgi:hypothetical protein